VFQGTANWTIESDETIEREIDEIARQYALLHIHYCSIKTDFAETVQFKCLQLKICEILVISEILFIFSTKLHHLFN